MPRNIIPEIAKLLDLELGEEFKIKGSPDWMLFHFEERGLRVRNFDEKVELSDGVDGALFERLLGGYLEVVKMAWKPKRDERYWTFDIVGLGNTLRVVRYRWDCDFNDLTKLKVGWVYRTRAEAEAALPGVAKELGVEYKLND